MKALISYTLPLPILFWLIFFSSCNGQKKEELPMAATTQPKEPGSKSRDYDPFFVASEVISTSQGPKSITRNIIQDRQGNIWLATWEGILRYDGNTFVNFTNKAGLKRFHAFCALEDREGNLWFGTIGAGVYRYDGTSFTHYTTNEGLVNDSVGCIYEDKSGNIWIGTEGGVSLLEASLEDEVSFRNFTTNEGLADNDVNAIVEDKNGLHWFAARGSACTYDGKKFTEFTNHLGATFENVRSMIEDKSGNLWLGGKNGLWRYNPDTVWKPWTRFADNFVGYVHEDRQGNIWTSSESNYAGTWALTRYEESSLHKEKAIAQSVRMEMGMLFGILEDEQGGIWFGSLNGVCRYDGKLFDCFGKDAPKK